MNLKFNTNFKGPLSGLGHFLTTASPLKMTENAFSFILKVVFVLEIFTFLFWLFGYAEIRFDKKSKVNFKIYGVTDWTTNKISKSNQAMKFGQWRV